ncbi:hypothetical protein ACFVFQ_29070 [Streptomyces sp. NPDC057743]|uniref:hypothetical protein n=1 Tax=Streptomyces sp. NPDC057743 TaxID=3346236 RepID=UPI0036BF637F
MTERLVDEMTAHGHPAGLQAAVGYDQREIATAQRELRHIEGLVVGGLCEVPVRW